MSIPSANKTWTERFFATGIGQAVERGWVAIRHPRRRGLPDPTWMQASVAMIAVGAFLTAVEAATAASLRTDYSLLYVGYGITAAGVLGVLLCAMAALLRKLDDRDTPFNLQYDDGDWECNEQFPDLGWQQIRVAVTNKSPVGVQRVRVFMRALSGSDRNHFLHIEHDNDPLRHVSRTGEYLTVRQTVYFDVAIAKPKENIFAFNYADIDIQEMSIRTLDPMKLIFRLEVSGWTDFRDVNPLSKDFRLTVDKTKRMTLEEIKL